MMASQGQTGSTEHFWYRLQPAGPYIDSQRDHKAIVVIALDRKVVS